MTEQMEFPEPYVTDINVGNKESEGEKMTREEAICKVEGYLTDIIPSENYSEVEEIMKALEQEPETVTEFADRCRECGAKYGKALEQTRWIPVSERLPKYNTPVLLALKQIGKERTIVIGERRTRKSGWYFVDIAVYDTEHEVIAWMPLPESYRESEEV